MKTNHIPNQRMYYAWHDEPTNKNYLCSFD